MLPLLVSKFAWVCAISSTAAYFLIIWVETVLIWSADWVVACIHTVTVPIASSAIRWLVHHAISVSITHVWVTLSMVPPIVRPVPAASTVARVDHPVVWVRHVVRIVGLLARRIP